MLKVPRSPPLQEANGCKVDFHVVNAHNHRFVTMRNGLISFQKESQFIHDQADFPTWTCFDIHPSPLPSLQCRRID